MKKVNLPVLVLFGLAAGLCPATASAQEAERSQFIGSLKSGEALQDLSVSGPMLSAVFHW